MPEEVNESFISKSNWFCVLFFAGILVGVVIAIPIVYSVGRKPGLSDSGIQVNQSEKQYVNNECTQLRPPGPLVLEYLVNEEPFPYKYYSYRYRPSVIVKEVSLIFGFRHDTKSWSLDNVSFIDLTTSEEKFDDGGFESNYLRQSYSQCILSSTRSSTTDILFDLPYSDDFYYNDQTTVGMTYLSQKIDVTGGRFYNISYYLENRGYKDNTFLLLVRS